MNQSGRKILSYIAIGIFALVIFQLKVGFDKLTPENDEWLLIKTTDRLPDYLTWRYFNKVDIHELPDTINYSYPQRISPIYTNIIPLVAYPVKWTGIAKNENFQYHGAWFLLCFLLQGLFGLYFLYSLGIKNEWFAFLGGCFFVISLPLLFRLDHPALVHHWTVIAALIPFFKSWKPAYSIVWYLVLAIIAATTHPYMLLFGAGIPVIYFFHQWVNKRRFLWQEAVVPIAAIGVSFLLLWAMGAFGFEVSTASGGGFGYYSANLNSFYNSHGYTRSPLAFDTYYAGAYEGMAYMGIGLLVLLLAMIVVRWREVQNLRNIFKRKWVALTFGVMAFTFFAFSDVWTFHNTILVSWPEFGLEKYFGIFRSSGRYIWLSFYLFMGLILWGWASLPFNNKWILLGLIMALILQLWEFQLFIKDQIHGNSQIEEFSESNWIEILAPFDKIIIYPPYHRTLYSEDDVSHIIYMASYNAIPITAGHLPRPDQNAQGDMVEKLKRLLSENPDHRSLKDHAGSLFVTTMGYLPNFHHLVDNHDWKVRSIGNYIMVVHPKGWEEHKDILKMYTQPFYLNELTHLEDWLDKHEKGHTIIVGQDEVTTHPGPGFMEWMAERQSEFTKVAFRDAYFARFENGKLMEEEWNADAVQDTFLLDNFQWVVRSEGNKAGNESYIIINNEKFDELSRGLNIFHISEGADSITYAHFDTYVTNAMQKEYRFSVSGEQK